MRRAVPVAICAAAISAGAPARGDEGGEGGQGGGDAWDADAQDDALVYRVPLEALGFLVAGFAAVAAVGLVADGDDDYAPIVAVPAIVLAPPAGVALAGAALDANGGYWWSVLGYALGWLPAIAVISLASDMDGAGDAGLAAIFALAFSFPMAGSIFGYEITNEPEEPERRRTFLDEGGSPHRRSPSPSTTHL